MRIPSSSSLPPGIDKTQLTTDLDQACWRFLLPIAGRYSYGPTVVNDFLRISSQTSVVYRSRSFEWLDKNPEHTSAYQLLAPLVAGAPTDVEIRSRAVTWLDDNPEHPQVYWLLAPLVAGAPKDVEIRSRAVTWLDNNWSIRRRISCSPPWWPERLPMLKSAPVR
jgi:hypothetical protein